MPLAREHGRSRYVSFLSLPILKPMFINRTNTLLQWPHVLLWLGYEIVFCFVNDIIDDSILFSQFYSTAHRVCAKTATNIHNGPARDVRNEAPSKICMRPDASATWKKISMLVSWRVLLLHEKYALLTVMALATLSTLSAQCGSGVVVAKLILHVGID